MALKREKAIFFSETTVKCIYFSYRSNEFLFNVDVSLNRNVINER